MNFLEVVYRTFLSALTLFLLAKAMGRKQIGELNTFDYIIGITIGSIASEMTVNSDVSLINCIVAMAVLSLIGILISYGTTKSMFLRRFFTGCPIILIENGKIIEKGLNKARFDINDLLQECRINGYFDISEIAYAVMEANGRISFLLKSKYTPVTLSDMKIKASKKGLCVNLIIDGNIMMEHLKNINKDSAWLLTRLENMGYSDYSNILLASCDTKEQITVYLKSVPLTNSKVLE
ncbi:MAG: DUF421 domain-containing protein [Clostridium sp.]|mgnify:FL=1|nr:DUF421 domain-containing protein [Clostridium sp.]